MEKKMSTPIYLDNNATTRVAPEVFEAMIPYLQEQYGNPSSMYSFAKVSADALNQSRQMIAAGLGALPEEIIFVSCGSEADSTAVFSALESQPNKKHFITSKVEHPAILELGKYLLKKGYRVTFIDVDEAGRLDLQQLEDALTDDTALVSIMFANNETGTINDIARIAEMVKSRGILFHTDAVQAIGKIPINLQKLPVDMLSLSGHKIHAPKGVAALYLRKGTPFTPFLRGGHQENHRRAGTENLASIVGLGKALELSLNNLEFENTQVQQLRNKLEKGLIEQIENTKLNGDSKNRLPNTLNISFEFVEGESILLMLNEFGICASTGSACSSGSLEPSHVLRAMKVPQDFLHGSVRFSLSRYTTESEIEQTLEIVPKVIERLRQISPFKRI